jgi:hypothetical protein
LYSSGSCEGTVINARVFESMAEYVWLDTCGETVLVICFGLDICLSNKQPCYPNSGRNIDIGDTLEACQRYIITLPGGRVQLATALVRFVILKLFK